MFEIVLTACLASGDVCATRMLPVSLADRSICEARAPAIADDWATGFMTEPRFTRLVYADLVSSAD